MAKLKYSDLKARAARLLAQAEKLRRREVAGIAKELAARLNEHEIGLAELKAAGYAYAGGRGAAKRSPAKKAPRAKVVPKYRDPKNAANTWTGRGRPPRWLQAYLDAGKTRDEFLIG